MIRFMLKHIFIMLWNQRRKYTAVIFEQMLVFIAVALSLTIVYDTIKSYHMPGNLDTDGVIGFGYVISGKFKPEESAQSVLSMDIIKERLEKKPYVEAISESLQFIPYARPSAYYWSDSVTFVSGKKAYVHFKGTDESAEKVFRPEMTDGRWFRDGERVNGQYPAVITQQLVETSGLASPIGKTIYLRGMAFTITGVVAGIKEDVLSESPPSIIVPINVLLPFGSTGINEELAARIKPGYEDEFANDFYKEFNLAWNSSDATELYLASLADDKAANMEKSVIGVVSTSIPALFLLIFTVIGSVGINFMDIQTRKRELALRISCGSTVGKAIVLIIGQNIILTGLSSIPGIIVIMSIYPLEISMPIAAITLLFALLISFLCALYPAFGILKMNPAELLKE